MDVNEKRDIIRAVFDALPSLVMVVDQDVRIQEFNAAAAEFLMADRRNVLKLRAGDVLNCIHSHEVPAGCGKSPSCKNCIIQNSVTESFHGRRIVRRRAKIELIREVNKIEIYALITASPFSFQNKPLVLLVIEDISEIAELYRLIPICCVCGKVRDDKESWMRVEAYFKENWDVDFSHGLCPDCYTVEKDKLESYNKAKQRVPVDTDKPRR